MVVRKGLAEVKIPKSRILALIVVKLTPKQFILILFIKTYLTVPKPSLYDLPVESYDQNRVKKWSREETKNDQNLIFWAFQALIVAILTPTWFILILFIKTYILVPKTSLYDRAKESYDQNQAQKGRPKMTKIKFFWPFRPLQLPN